MQAQILEVLQTARDVTGAGVLIITHDLGVVAEFADRALVMYAGRAVEVAGVDELYRDRRMPYTAGLLGSVPRLDSPQGSRLVPIPGAPPSLVNLPPGCPFAPRCPLAVDDCRAGEPALLAVGGGHAAACIRTEHVKGRTAAEIYGVSTQPVIAEDESEPEVVVSVRDLVKTYRLTKGVVFRRQIGEVRAVDGISFDLPRGRTLGIVGESGSGQVDHAARDPRTGRAAVGIHRSPRQRRRHPDPGAPARVAPRPAGGVPGSGGRAGPTAAGLRVAGRTAGRQRFRQVRHRHPGGRAAGDRRAGPRRRQPLRAGVLRRPEAAHRHRPSAGAAAQDTGPRRTGLGAGRLHPGRHHQPAARSAARSSTCPTCSSPTTCRWSNTWPTGWR